MSLLVQVSWQLQSKYSNPKVVLHAGFTVYCIELKLQILARMLEVVKVHFELYLCFSNW